MTNILRCALFRNMESWQLRSHMMFVVDNLQHYLMADVLESQCSLLHKKLDESTNFEELRHAHDVFLNSIVAHTFVNNKPVNYFIVRLIFMSFCVLTIILG